MKKLYLCFIISIAVMMLSVSCSNDDSSNSPSLKNDNGISTSSYNAVYTDNTVYFDSTDTSLLINSNSVNHKYTFSRSSEKAQSLKIGDIILIHGKALRKVSKKVENGNNIVIETEYATLNEAIKDGNIKWTTHCGFNIPTNVSIMMKNKVYYPRILSSDELDFNFESGAYKYHIYMKLLGTSANVMLEVEKSIGSAIKGKFTAEGNISSFDSENDIQFSNSQLVKYNNSNKNLKGDLTLSLTAAGSGNDALNLEMPVVLFKYPLMVGPIPTTINVKAQIVVNAVVPLDGSAKISTKFKYDSETGFKYNGTTTETSGNIGSYSIDKKETETGASSAIGVNFGIGFPRLEVQILGETIVPWIQTAFLISGDFTVFPVCRQVRASFIGGCGVDFDFLGLAKYSMTKNLWQKDKEILKVGDCK